MNYTQEEEALVKLGKTVSGFKENCSAKTHTYIYTHTLNTTAHTKFMLNIMMLKNLNNMALT